MTVKVDVLGWRQLDDEPAFQIVEGGFYYHLRSKRLFEIVTFDAKLVAEGKTFAADEVGYASIRYVMDHEDMLHSYVPPAGSAQMNVTITTAPTATPDSVGVITVTGGPTDEPLVLRISTMDSTSLEQTDTIVYVSMTGELTVTEVADKISAATHDALLTSVANVAGVVTFTPSTGGTIDVFTLDTDRPY